MQGVVDVCRGMEKGACVLTTAFGSGALQVAANQEYAQTVDHVHFHVVPASPAIESSDILQKWNSAQPMSLIGRRGELTDDEGAEVGAALARAVAQLMPHARM